MNETPRDLQPVAIDEIASFDYSVRAAALRLINEKIINGPPHLYAFALDDTLANDRLREVLDCLAAMAIAAFAEYYTGNAGTVWVSAEETISRELHIAETLMGDPPLTGGDSGG